MAGADGGVFADGHAGFFGSFVNQHLNAPIVGIVATPDGGGYWMVASDGGVFAFGDAGFFGSAVDQAQRSCCGDGRHAGREGVLARGIRRRGVCLRRRRILRISGHFSSQLPIVGMAATPDGHGHWLVASDGGVFTLGDATYLGSQATSRLNGPIVGMAAGA